MTWQACVRDCSDFYPAADVSHGRGHIRTQLRMIPSTERLHLLLARSLAVIGRTAPAILGRGSRRERFVIRHRVTDG